MTRFRLHSPVDRDQRALPLFVESLERRQLLAGVVNVDVAGSTLSITGDAQDNDILVQGLLVSSGANSTQIQINYDGGELSKVKNVSINLGDGNDRLSAQNMNLPNKVSIDNQHGDKTLEIRNSLMKRLDIENGTGTHDITIQQSLVDGNATIRNGDGNSQLLIQSFLGSGRSIHGNLSISNGDGDHTITISGVRVRNRSINIVNGVGNTDIAIANSDRIRNIIVSNGPRSGPPDASHSHRLVLNNTRVETGQVKITNRGGDSQTTIQNNTSVQRNVTGVNFAKSNDTLVNHSLTVSSGSSIGGKLAWHNSIPSAVGGNTSFGLSDSTVGGDMQLINEGDGDFAHVLDNVEIGRRAWFVTIARSTSTVTDVDIKNSSNLGALIYSARMSPAGDQIRVENSTVEDNVNINTGDGAAVVQFFGSTIQGKLDVVNTFKGRRGNYEMSEDEFWFYDSAAWGPVSVDHGSGGSYTDLNRSTFSRGVEIRGNQGRDRVFLDDVSVQGGITDIRTNNASQKEFQAVEASLPDDDDLVSIERFGSFGPGSSTFDGAVFIRTGRGDDDIRIGSDSDSQEMAVFHSQLTIDGELGVDQLIMGALNQFDREPIIRSIEA